MGTQIGTQIGIIFFIVALSELAASFFKNQGLEYKPFNCSLCLCFWISIPFAYFWINDVDLGVIPYIGWVMIIRQILWRILY